MNCARAQELIDGQQFGGGGAEEASVAEHLRGCAECRRFRAGLEREQAFFDAYAARQRLRLEPSAGAWLEIERRIARDGAGPRTSGWRPIPLAFAAALAAAVGLAALWLVVQREERSRPEPPRAAAARSIPAREGAPEALSAGGTGTVPAPATAAAEAQAPRAASSLAVRSERAPRPIESIRRAEREYLQAITLLDSTLAERRAALGPEQGRALDTTLETVDQAIAASRRVYRAHPHDFELAEYMLAAYARKIEVLQDLGS